MIERRLDGRRRSDRHSSLAAPSLSPTRERRLNSRRCLDRGGNMEPPESLLPGRRHRPALLYTVVVCCATCNREWERAKNISREGRRHFIADHSGLTGTKKACCCLDTTVTFEWLLQAGLE